MTTKDIAIKTIQGLPDNASWSDIEERIRFLAAIDKGLEEDIVSILMELNESLETMIRKYPDQWNWIYKRWS